MAGHEIAVNAVAGESHCWEISSGWSVPAFFKLTHEVFPSVSKWFLHFPTVFTPLIILPSRVGLSKFSPGLSNGDIVSGSGDQSIGVWRDGKKLRSLPAKQATFCGEQTSQGKVMSCMF